MREYLTLRQLKALSNKRITYYQNQRFAAMCENLLSNVPFYKELFKKYGVDPSKLKSVEDWHKQGLPLIKKATYMKRPKDFVLQPDKKTIFKSHLDFLSHLNEFGEAVGTMSSAKKEEILKSYYSPKMLIFSGGTESGNPTPVFLTSQQKFNTLYGVLEIVGKLITNKFGAKHTVGMNAFPYGPHLGWHAVHHALDINADLNLCTAAGGAMSTERLIALAGKTQPNIICGMSDYLRNRFLPLAIERKIKLPSKVLFVNGAQKMHSAEREKIAALASKLGVKKSTVIDLYGASELKESLMPECVPGGGFHHIAPLSTIVRTVKVNHATKDVIDDWEFSDTGYLTSWNIDGGGTLLEGYIIGDKAEKVLKTKCPKCQLNVTRFFEINRIREVEAQLKLTGMIEAKVKGARVNLVAIRDIALSIPEVQEAQVFVNKKRIELRIVSKKAAIAKRKLEKKFAGAEIKPKIIVSSLAKLRGNKLKFEAIKVE